MHSCSCLRSFLVSHNKAPQTKPKLSKNRSTYMYMNVPNSDMYISLTHSSLRTSPHSHNLIIVFLLNVAEYGSYQQVRVHRDDRIILFRGGGSYPELLKEAAKFLEARQPYSIPTNSLIDDDDYSHRVTQAKKLGDCLRKFLFGFRMPAAGFVALLTFERIVLDKYCGGTVDIGPDAFHLRGLPLDRRPY